MKYLFFISQNYSFEILRPLQKAALARGDEVLWCLYRNKVNTSLFSSEERYTVDVADAVKFRPDVTFVPGNIVPNFIPGLKVQVFHGFEWKKKGHFTIRDCFDLYCTQGQFFTERFTQLANKHRHFDVIETGWPKLDTLFDAKPLAVDSKGKSIILYAPTFSPSMTSAESLFEQIQQLSQNNKYHWLIKFHPKMAEHWVEKYKSLTSDSFQVLDTAEIGPLLQAADVMVSDTSSIITEFMLLNKPVITFKNQAPEPCLIDITQAQQLAAAIDSALNPSPELRQEIAMQIQKMHPYSDGLSSERILAATDKLLKNGKRSTKRRPMNILRNLKMRKTLGYWKFSPRWLK